jgi:hypothetical protein
LSGGEGGAARPDNVLRGAAVLLMAQRSPSPAPSEEEDKDAADAPTVSQKKGQGKKARQERRDAADGQNGSQTEEHAEKQQDTRTESKKAVSEKKKTQNVPEEGNGGRLTFKDLQSVSNYTDKVFIGKLAKNNRSYPVFCSCARNEGRNAVRSFIARVLLFVWLTVLVFRRIVCLTSLNDRFF